MQLSCKGVEQCPPRIHVYLDPVNMTFFGGRVFVGVISYNKVILNWGPNPENGILFHFIFN